MNVKNFVYQMALIPSFKPVVSDTWGPFWISYKHTQIPLAIKGKKKPGLNDGFKDFWYRNSNQNQISIQFIHI